MKTISTNELRSNLADYLDKVDNDDLNLIISRFGKPKAMLVPVNTKPSSKKIEDFRGFLADKNDSTDGVSFENKIRRTKKEAEYVKKIRAGLPRHSS